MKYLRDLMNVKIIDGVPDVAILCPHCKKSSLKFNVSTADQCGDGVLQPVTGTASAIAACPICNNSCSFNGTYIATDDVVGGETIQKITAQPIHFHPPIHIDIVHNNFPESSRNVLEESMSYIFNDKKAALNKIRQSLEILMDYYGIRKYTAGSNSKEIDLHNRIEKFRKKGSKYSKVSDALLSLKWLGNLGSHARAKVNSEMLIEAFEIIAFVNRILFCKKLKIEDEIKKINDTKAKGVNKWIN